MRLTFFFPLRVFDDESDAPTSPPRSMDGIVLAEESLADFLDRDLADLGVVGGKVRLSAKGGDWELEVVYWMPDDFDEAIIKRLHESTVIQLEDGLGEGGFTLQTEKGNIVIFACTETPPRHEIQDDGRHLAKPPLIAISARDGDMSTLDRALQASGADVNQTLQGYTAVQLAILSGNVDAIMLLLAAGADSNRTDPSGQTPLELCALSNSLNDEQSCIVARRLLEAGADPGHIDNAGESAKSYALLRQKETLAEIL